MSQVHTIQEVGVDGKPPVDVCPRCETMVTSWHDPLNCCNRSFVLPCGERAFVLPCTHVPPGSGVNWKRINAGCPRCDGPLQHHSLTWWCLRCGLARNWDEDDLPTE